MSSTNINCVNRKYYLQPWGRRPRAAWSRTRWGRRPAVQYIITVQYNAVQCSAAQYSTVQLYSTNPGEDAVLHGRGEAAPLGGVRVQVPAHDVLDPLRRQDQQNWHTTSLNYKILQLNFTYDVNVKIKVKEPYFISKN